MMERYRIIQDQCVIIWMNHSHIGGFLDAVPKNGQQVLQKSKVYFNRPTNNSEIKDYICHLDTAWGIVEWRKVENFNI